MTATSDPLTTVAWSPLSRDLLVASEFEVQLWDSQTGRSIGTVLSQGSEKQGLITAIFDSAGQILVIDHYLLHTMGVKAGMPIFKFPSSILNARFGSHSKLLATSSLEGTKVWDLDDGVRLIVQLPDKLPADSLALSPNGRYLVTSTKDATNIWSLPLDKRLLRSYEIRDSGHGGAVEAMAFSPDGRSLALAGSDGTTGIYAISVRLAQAIAVLRGHVGAVRSVAFSPDGKLIATASDDTTVRLWNLAWRPPGTNLDWKALLKYLRAETKACLTDEQRSRLLSENPKEAYE